jgi:dTDP-4-amino-4,6-dideoxygalactose transaminase
VEPERRVWLARPQLGDEEVEEVRAVLASGYLTQGPKVEQFESMVAKRTGSRHAVAVTSATTALHLSLAALDIGPGDEVLVADFTFPATANVVVQQGATPILVDIDLDTFAMNADDLERRITTRSRAIMPVHPFGLPADLAPILAIAERAGLPVVEDAACALGATYRGAPAGSLGTTGCFSFHPRKSITTGEGGMVVTADDALAERLRLLRSHGGVRAGGRFTFEAAGYNYRLSDILAGIGVAQMRKLDAFLDARRRVAHWYDERLSSLERVRIPITPEWATHTFQSYVLLLDEGTDRDAVIAALRADGIETTLGTYALHAQPYFARTFGLEPGGLPASARAFRSTLAVPLHGSMTETDVDLVVERLAVALEAGS